MKTKALQIMSAVFAAGLSAGVAQAQQEQYLVVAAGNDFPDARVQAVQMAGGEILKIFPQIGVAVASSEDPAFATKAEMITGVASVFPDPIAVAVSDTGVSPFDAASKPVSGSKSPDLMSLQWGLQAIQVPGAWAVGATGKGVRVAVIDTGIMTTHPDLAPNLNLALSTSVVPGETVEFIPEGAKGGFSHATHVAGIIAAADNGFGTIGVAPDAELVAIKIGSDLTGRSRLSWMLEGLLYAAEIRADIANMSIGWLWEKRDPAYLQGPSAVSVAIRAARFAEEHGTLMVGAAGNVPKNYEGWWFDFPCSLPGAIGVSATTPLELWAYDSTVYLDWPAPYTTFGQEVIDLAAPGGYVDLLNRSEAALTVLTLEGITYPARAFNMVISTSSSFGRDGVYEQKGTWDFRDGTSMAAAHVSGAAALVIQSHAGKLTCAQLRVILQQSADDLGKPGNDDYYGAGRVNALRAVLQR